MKEILREKFILISMFIIFYLGVEIATFIWVDFSLLPNDLLIDLVLAFALSSIIFTIKSRKWSIIYLSFLYFVVVMLFFVNTTMFSVYYDLFTFQQLQLVGEAANVINSDLLSLPSILLTIGFLALFGIAFYFINRYLQRTVRDVDRFYTKSLSVFLASFIFVFSFFMIDNTTINAFVEDQNVTTFKRASFEKYGMLGYYVKELENIIENEEPVDASIPYKESLPTDYYGTMEGKNVITIMLESIQPFAINETLTPNLYMLSQEGLYFENSYSENKTNVSEVIAITGNYPTTGISANDYEYDFSFSLPSVLAEEGYKTTYIHDNVPTFYSRGALMPQLGFQNLYMHDDLYPGEPIWTWAGDYTLDSETMEVMLPYLISSDEPFYSFWASLSTHGPYNYGPENILLFETLGYFDQIDQAEADGLWTNELEGGLEEDIMRIRHYQAAVIDLDIAIGMMLDELEEQDLLDDTVIVLYGDHNVYYHNIYLKRFEDTDNSYYNMEMYHNFFCIYNPELTDLYLSNSGEEDSTISKFVSPYNIVPTLMDLFGIEYNQNIFMGSSVFSDYQEVFYSIKLTGFFNYNLFSPNGLDVIYAKYDPTVDELNEFYETCAMLKAEIGYVNRLYAEGRTRIED